VITSKQIKFDNHIYTEEEVDEFIDRYNQAVEPIEKHHLTPIEDLVVTNGINSTRIGKKTAKNVIKRFKGKENGFTFAKESSKVGISPVTLRNHIIKQLEGTGYELISTPRKTIIKKRD